MLYEACISLYWQSPQSPFVSFNGEFKLTLTKQESEFMTSLFSHIKSYLSVETGNNVIGQLFSPFFSLFPFHGNCPIVRGRHNVKILFVAAYLLDAFLKRGFVDNSYSGNVTSSRRLFRRMNSTKVTYMLRQENKRNNERLSCNTLRLKLSYIDPIQGCKNTCDPLLHQITVGRQQ